MKYYADKDKKYIGASDHGQVVDGAVYVTDVHPDDWDANTSFKKIDGVEVNEEEASTEDAGKSQDQE